MKRLTAVLAVVLASLMLFTACKTTVNEEKKDSTTTETQTEENKDTTEENKDTTEANSEVSEEEAWKKEPAYGKPVKIGYNGGLCTGAPGIADALGMFKKQGLEVELVKMDGTVGTVDAVGTGKVDMVTNLSLIHI